MLHTRSFLFVSCALVADAATALARDVPVDSPAALRMAIGNAQPGDVISLAPGRYRTTGERCVAAGTASAPIVVKSAVPLAAEVQVDAVEGFAVSGPHWHFEGLALTGVCAKDDDCEHAFHVTGAADGFVLRASRVIDFNAQLKVNAAQIAGAWRTPNAGLVEGNELADAHARSTSNPVTKLNIDTGDGWVVRANTIHDAHKALGDGISYAAFMKSGGRNGVFERNLVICSRDDLGGGVRIGLSFGGGGTGAQFCAPAFDAAVPCDPEHSGGTMRNNIVVRCSDVGIYLNKAKDTKLLFNTLIATSGIDFRFASSTGEADGNVLAGKIRQREGGTFAGKTNLTDVTTFDDWYVAPGAGDLTRKGDLSALLQKTDPRVELSDDYCARPRPTAKVTLGALEHSLGDCDTTRPPASMAQPVDAGTERVDASAGPASDAATGGPGADAGSTAEPDASSTAPGQGGGCSATGSSAQRGWGMLALVLAWRVRRRRHGAPNAGAASARCASA